MGSTWWEGVKHRVGGAWDVLTGRAYAAYSVPDVMGEVRLRAALIQIADLKPEDLAYGDTHLAAVIANHALGTD